MVDPQEPPIVKALFVRLIARDGKGEDVETFLREGLAAVLEEPDTTSWYAVRLGSSDFAIFDTFPNDAGRLAHLAGKVGQALVARAPELLEGARPSSMPISWPTSCRAPAPRFANDPVVVSPAEIDRRRGMRFHTGGASAIGALPIAETPTWLLMRLPA